MSDEWQTYASDLRPICKYRTKCYQKNSDHLNKYKHPPRNLKRKSPTKDMIKKPTSAKTQRLMDEVKIRPDTITKIQEKPSEISLKHNWLPADVQYYDATKEIKNIIKELFLVHMPEDFFKFYECLKETLNYKELLSSVNLELIGPYDLLFGKLPVLDDKELYLINWRFFYDPPEFQSVLKSKGKSEYHIGYFRDNPDEAPVFLASNDSSKDCHLTPIADNIFAAVYSYLQIEKQRTPFSANPCQKFMTVLKAWAETAGFNLEPYDMKKRLQNIVTKTFHGAGIVVPYDKKTKLGYRKLIENNATIKNICTSILKADSQTEKDAALSKLQPVITYGNIAVDECDFGTGLELGIALFSSGVPDLEQSALSVLSSTYSLLQRDAFSKIIQAHLKYRRKGPAMSINNGE